MIVVKRVVLNEGQVRFDMVEEPNGSVGADLRLIEERVKELYLANCSGNYRVSSVKSGVRRTARIGNQLKRDGVLQAIFGGPKRGIVLVKCTENRKAFYANFIRASLIDEVKELYLFVIDSDFNRRASIVDATSPSCSEIEEMLLNFFGVFAYQGLAAKIFIAELRRLDGLSVMRDSENLTYHTKTTE